MQQPVRVAIVGVGAHAESEHLSHYATCDNAVVTALIDPSTERAEAVARRFAQQTGRPLPRVFHSMEELAGQEDAHMDSELRTNAVSICSPNRFHTSQAIAALRHGWHVLLEKPMGVTEDDIDALERAAAKSDRIVMVGMSNRFRDDAVALARICEAGELGRVYYARARFLRRRGTPRGWFSDAAISGGGPLLDLGVHALDLAWWLMGQPDPVAVSGVVTRAIGLDAVDFLQPWTSRMEDNADNAVYDTEDFAAGFIRFSDGAALSFETSWSLNGEDDNSVHIDLFGTHAGVRLPAATMFTTLHGTLATTALAAGRGLEYRREIHHFVECVAANRAPLCTVAQGATVMRMLFALRESAAAGREIAIARTDVPGCG
ncbi:MAG: Gfo/Idh/MocA family oxidoreductase [Firmicutes bacterium]|nr:Gfo/Idh/MocA family oxidoreductase [Bacillota bacterium]